MRYGWRRSSGGRGSIQPCLLEAGDGSVEGSGAEAGSAEACDVFDHGVSVLGAAGEAGEDEQRRVGVVAHGRVVFGVILRFAYFA